MIKNLLIIFSAVWQEQPVALALYLAKKPMYEALILLIIGSCLGMTLIYFFPEEIRFISRLIHRFFRWLIHLMKKINSNRQLKKIRWYHLWSSKISKLRQKLISHMVNHSSPKIFVFIVAAIPLPGLLPIAIIVTRLLKLSYGYLIILTATITRTYILILTIYKIGGIFGQP